MANTSIPATLDDLFYHCLTGELLWKRDTGPRARKFGVAGCLCPQGYRRLNIQGSHLAAHRIIWERFNGPIPKGMEIDHENGNRSDNRIGNLRLCQHRQNMRNQKVQSRSTTGIKGVGFDKKSGLYRARVKTNGITTCRMFSDIIEAANWVAEEREKQHKEFHNHG